MSTADIFGIKMIYPPKPNSAKDWYMDHDPTRHDPRKFRV